MLKQLYKHSPKRAGEEEEEFYEDNGGTVLGICGKNFCLVAADTRASHSYEILSRTSSKVLTLSPKLVLAAGGMAGDRQALFRRMNFDFRSFKNETEEEMTAETFSQHLSNSLYKRRFFPYYAFCVLAALENDRGVLYNYDAVGSFQECATYCTGSGSKMGCAVLDAYSGSLGCTSTKLTKEEAVEVAKEAFLAMTERDIYTGDLLQICVLTKDGLEKTEMHLSND